MDINKMNTINRHYVEVPLLRNEQMLFHPAQHFDLAKIRQIQQHLDDSIMAQQELMSHGLFLSTIVILNKTLLHSRSDKEGINLILESLTPPSILGEYSWQYIERMIPPSEENNLYTLSTTEGSYKRRVKYGSNNLQWYLYKIVTYCKKRYPRYNFRSEIQGMTAEDLLKNDYNNALMSITYEIE